MRHFPLTLLMLLGACGPNAVALRGVPEELLTVPQGWQGPTPTTEGESVAAMLADRRALLQCQGQLGAIAELP